MIKTRKEMMNKLNCDELCFITTKIGLTGNIKELIRKKECKC